MSGRLRPELLPRSEMRFDHKRSPKVTFVTLPKGGMPLRAALKL